MKRQLLIPGKKKNFKIRKQSQYAFDSEMNKKYLVIKTQNFNTTELTKLCDILKDSI